MKAQKQLNPVEIEPVDQEVVKKPIKKIKIVFILLLSLLLLLTISVFSYASWYLGSFSKASSTNKKENLSLIRNGIQTNPFESQDQINILLLGLDDFGIGREGSVLTDTIILTSINKDGSIALVPFPRDLWIDPLKTKINALYYYGEKSQDISGPGLVKKTISEISGLPIDYSLVLNLGFLEKVIQIIGDVTIDVEVAFVDDKYPNPDVAPDILPVELRYQTVSFEKGLQQMDAKTAIEYIRSRQSQNESENTDNARSVRQQKLINAIIDKITSKEVISNPDTVGSLYKLWNQEINTDIPMDVIIGMINQIRDESISINSLQIPTQSLESEGILYSPPISLYKQWVYIPHDPSWNELQDYVAKNLHPAK